MPADDPAQPPAPLRVPGPLAGERVDRSLALLTGWSRAEVGRLCEQGAVRVGGRAVARSRRLQAGELLEVAAAPPGEVALGPDPRVEVVVRHADDDVIVVSKPPGLVVHPGAGHSSGTLVHGLLARFPEVATVGDPARPGIVHRLDRGTSGLLVVARSGRAYDRLVAALAARQVERAYVALVLGVPDATRGVIDAPLGRSSRNRARIAVRADGREARTRYEVWGRFGSHSPAVSVLACTLETGRTHQVRAHLAAIGHPVAGDTAYGGAAPGLALERPFLHASVLRFAHPATGKWARFEEPLPADLAAVLKGLGPPG